MKILEIFKNPMKKLSPNEKEEFYRITNSENTKRLFWVNIIIALVTFIPVISILVFQSKGQWIDTPVYTYYLMVYIARIVFCTTIAVISYIFICSLKKLKKKLKKNE